VSRRLAVRAGLGLVALFLACSPVEGTPLSQPPENACPCSAYPQLGRLRPTCASGNRCEVLGQPDYPFTLIVHVPETSFFAAGVSYAIRSTDIFSGKGTPRCPPASCIALPSLVEVTGEYLVTAQASAQMGAVLPTNDPARIPARVTFVPLAASASSAEPRDLGLPLDVAFAQPVRLDEQRDDLIQYQRPVGVGRYRRIAEPEPPFDLAYPPVVSEISVSPTSVRRGPPDIPLFTESLVVGGPDLPLDDPQGDNRTATAKRAAGLDGWRLWLIDTATRRRISSRRRLSGFEMQARLDTVGANRPGTTVLRDGVSVVLAPPEGFIAVPSLESPIIGGQGLSLDYPELPVPAQVAAVAVSPGPTPSPLRGRVVFTSRKLRRLDGLLTDLLKYTTHVTTDDRGQLRTVLPPGQYDAYLEPEIGSGFGQSRTPIEVQGALSQTLVAADRTLVRGRAVLSDGRPLAEATVLATAAASRRAAAAPWELPRFGQATTDALGGFSLFLEQGDYDVAVVPQDGTGFPRVVTPRNVGPGQVDLGTVTVPAPTRLAYTLRDPSGNPIVRAVVRAFAQPASGAAAVEVGRGLSGSEGQFEILLAQQPR
jgi:hypothetical protein